MKISSLSEALDLSTAKEYRREWNPNKYKDLFAKVGAKYRIYIPFDIGLEELDRNSQRIRENLENLTVMFNEYYIDSPKITKFETTIADDDYMNGYIHMVKGKQKMKLGRALSYMIQEIKKSLDSPELNVNVKGFLNMMVEYILKWQTAFMKDNNRTKQSSGYIVISRHPYDIAGMSTDRHWTSCMEIGGSNGRYVIYDVAEGSLVAYVVRGNDKNIKNPLARITIKPYISVKNPKDVLLVTEPDMYGTKIQKFKEIVQEYIDKLNNQHDNIAGMYCMPSSLYSDSHRRTILTGEIEEVTDKESQANLIAALYEYDAHKIDYLSKLINPDIDIAMYVATKYRSYIEEMPDNIKNVLTSKPFIKRLVKELTNGEQGGLSYGIGYYHTNETYIGRLTFSYEVITNILNILPENLQKYLVTNIFTNEVLNNGDTRLEFYRSIITNLAQNGKHDSLKELISRQKLTKDAIGNIHWRLYHEFSEEYVIKIDNSEDIDTEYYADLAIRLAPNSIFSEYNAKALRAHPEIFSRFIDKMKEISTNNLTIEAITMGVKDWFDMPIFYETLIKDDNNKEKMKDFIVDNENLLYYYMDSAKVVEALPPNEDMVLSVIKKFSETVSMDTIEEFVKFQNPYSRLNIKVFHKLKFLNFACNVNEKFFDLISPIIKTIMYSVQIESNLNSLDYVEKLLTNILNNGADSLKYVVFPDRLYILDNVLSDLLYYFANNNIDVEKKKYLIPSLFKRMRSLSPDGKDRVEKLLDTIHPDWEKYVR